METDPRYPIGRFTLPTTVGATECAAWIAQVVALPARLREAVRGLSREQLDTPYREGGWTVRQVVHHVPDSHLNAYVRTKLALTEDVPTIKPFDEARWSELPDARGADPEISLRLLASLHERWAAILGAMGPADFARTLHHPEHGRAMSLDELLALYAWHGRHHTGQVMALRERKGW